MFEKADVVTETPKSKEILKVMPTEAANWMADKVSRTENF